jgi:hypothetical protein
MEILSLTIILISLILLGIIMGVYMQGKIDALHQHIDSVHNEFRVEAAILRTKVIHLERGLDDTRNNIKAIPEREETTDPNIRWGK